MEILHGILDKLGGAFSVCFKDIHTGNIVMVGNEERFEELEGGSILLVTPNGFKGCERVVKWHFLEEEAGVQASMFVWVTVPEP